MSISGEVAPSIENSASAADSNGDKRSALLTRATRIIPASRADYSLVDADAVPRYRHRK